MSSVEKQVSDVISSLPRYWMLPRDLNLVPGSLPASTSMVYTLISQNLDYQSESYIGQTIFPKERFKTHLKAFQAYMPFMALWELVDVDEVDLVERDRIHEDMPELNRQRYGCHSVRWRQRRQFPAVMEAHERNLRAYFSSTPDKPPEGSWYAIKRSSESMSCEYFEH